MGRMYATNGNAQRSRWEVLWIKKGRVVGKDCGADFAEALRIYGLALQAGKKGATLRCKNMSFAPPEKYADHETIVVTRGGKRYKKTVVIYPYVYHHRMTEMNLKGIWWCPYCVKMRRFTKKDRITGPVMECPMCKASNQLGTVKMYNPHASRDLGRRTRSDKGVRRG